MGKRILKEGIALALCLSLAVFCGCGGEKEEENVVPKLLNETESINLTAKSFYPDYDVLMERLFKLRYGIENGIYTAETYTSEIEAARRELQQLGYYYDYEGRTSVSADDGTVYGASPASGLPVGGGEGYPLDIDLSNAIVIEDDTDFYFRVMAAKPGDVLFLDPSMDIALYDLKETNFPDLVIPEGVTIASSRGADGEGGAVLRMSAQLASIFGVSSNVRLAGLVIQGADPETYDTQQEYTRADGIVPNGTGRRKRKKVFQINA